jgi:uncharacterized protein
VIVVSDTSAITSLAAIGYLSLLRELYGTVIIPEIVYRELLGPPVSAGAEEAQRYDWIQVRSLTDSSANRVVVESLRNELDSGESEAIALALELEADLMLIDERLGRNVARRVGLKVTGAIGVLIKAKEQTLIEEVRPLLDALRSEAGFRIAKDLYERAL